MAIAIGVWSQVLTPGKELEVIPPADLRITNVALGEKLEDAEGRTVVKITFDTLVKQEDDEGDEIPPSMTTVLCSLTGGKIEQVTTDLILETNEKYVFELVGKNIVHLTGNYVDQTSADQPDYDESDSDSDSEEGYDLREVSSDVEIHPDDVDDLESDASRFEEMVDVEEKPKKTPKRPRASDAAEEQKIPPEAKKAKVDSGKKEKKREGEVAEKQQAKPKAAEQTIGETGIKFVDFKTGTGPAAKKGDVVHMRYVGKLLNGKIFDQNTKGKPFIFRLGQNEVIKGWDAGIVGMSVGGERKLTIPAAMAYGKKGTDGIPPNSTLMFDVKLVSIHKKK